MPIRVQFFRVFEQDHMHIDPVEVTAGNEAADHGCLPTAVCVFDKMETNQDDFAALELIYAMSVFEAPRYTVMLTVPPPSCYRNVLSCLPIVLYLLRRISACKPRRSSLGTRASCGLAEGIPQVNQRVLKRGVDTRDGRGVVFDASRTDRPKYKDGCLTETRVTARYHH